MSGKPRKSSIRIVTVEGRHIRVKSVFDGKLPLEKVIANIVKQKLSNAIENNKR